MSRAQNYLYRSPRYVLQTQDLKQMRFATMGTRGTSISTEVINVSDTGLAFTMGQSNPSPEEGEILKVEFSIPGREQIACFATVVRVDEINQWHPITGDRKLNMVGLHFRNLPSAYRKLLQRGLESKINNEEISQWLEMRRKHLISFSGLCVGMTGLMYLMVLPISSWLSPLKLLF